MYSILPSIVAILFLFYGLYVLNAKGLNRVTTAFLILCTSTFFWQFAWAILFQVKDPVIADYIIKIGWLLILFLPSSLYHFLVEITGRSKDLKYVYVSYVVAGMFSTLLIITDYLIDGHYIFFFGYYPKAGTLHFLHVLQTCVVVTRGLYITYKKQTIAQAEEKTKLRYCTISLLIYFFAAIDYLCNYGVEFYPPGVVFILVSLGIIALATARYEVMDSSRIIASSIAHEMRTPLATLRAQSQIIEEYLLELINGYQHLKEDDKKLSDDTLNELKQIISSMKTETRSINDGIDTLLALTSYQYLDKKDFHLFSIGSCIKEAIGRLKTNTDLISTNNLHIGSDFTVYASREFLIFVMINLIKNSLDAIEKKGSGTINIYTFSDKHGNQVKITDTGCGIEEDILPHIFDKFFTTKERGKNSGVGLAFCRTVMESFGGSISCQSTLEEYTSFRLIFKKV